MKMQRKWKKGLKKWVRYLYCNSECKSKKLYRVQTGAFSVKQNAINLQNRLKKDGYDCFITT